MWGCARPVMRYYEVTIYDGGQSHDFAMISDEDERR
jgi:hypothetical protein